MNKCYPCRYAAIEEAAKERVFIRCMRTGRVMNSAPANYGRLILEETNKPMWCEVKTNEGP